MVMIENLFFLINMIHVVFLGNIIKHSEVKEVLSINFDIFLDHIEL